MIAIQGINIKTDDEIFSNASIGLYSINNRLSLPEAASIGMYYRMNAGTGTSIYDESGNDVTGTLTPGAWVDSKRGFGKCVEFDGTAGNITIPQTFNYDTYSIAAWVYIDSDGEGSDSRIWDSGNDFIQISAEAGGFVKITFKVDYGAGTDATANTGVTVPISTWTHVLCTHDNGTGANKIYINGADVTAGAVAGVGTHTTILGAWTVGNSTVSGNSMDGKIDNFIFWGAKALTSGNVTTVYGMATSPPNFRWIETAPQNATTLTWLSSFIMQGGVGGMSEGGDLRLYGGLAKRGNTSVTVDNSALLWNTLSTIGMDLQGLKAEVWEFVDDGASPDGVQLFAGKIDDISWNETDYLMTIRNSYDERKSNLGTVVDVNDSRFTNASDADVGRNIPVTLGRNDNSKFKLIRITNTETIYNASEILGITVTSPTDFIPKMFKVNAITDGVTFDLKVANTITIDSLSILQSFLVGKYIKIIEGDNNEGAYRKIATVAERSAAAGTLAITITQWFDATSPAYGIDTSTWVAISGVDISYMPDTWDLYSYYSSDGDILSGSNIDLFIYDNGYSQLPSYAIITDITSSNTLIETESTFFIADPRSIFGYKIIPVDSVALIDSVARFGLTEGVGNWSKKEGTYWYSGDGLTQLISTTGTIDNVTDGNSTTGYNIKVAINLATSDTMYLLVGLKFDFPVIPDNFNFDDIYMLINSSITYNVTPNGKSLEFRSARFVNGVIAGDSTDINPTGNSTNNIIDEYLSNGPVDATNQSFFLQRTGGTVSNHGYKLFKLSSVDGRDKYSSLNNGVFWYWFQYTAAGGPISDFTGMDFTFNEFALMATKSKTIGSDLYTTVRGRIYNDTWGGRKISALAISNPIDALEHVCRLQNWQEVDPAPALGWGKAYATNAAINAGDDAEGDFDYSELDPWRNMWYGRQFLTASEAESDFIKNEICRVYGLVQYVGTDGSESINTMASIGGSLDTITLADITNMGDIIEPSVEDIFVEPTVEYGFDAGYNKFLNQISITHADADIYDSTYVTGVTSDTDAENLWNLAHALWPKCRTINKPSATWTGLHGVTREADAIRILQARLEWMANPRIDIDVSYETGRLWFFSKHINIQLPHQTNNQEVECLLEKVNRDKNNNKVSVTMIILDNLPSISYFVQDTFKSGTVLDYWQDTFSAGSNNSVQDTAG